MAKFPLYTHCSIRAAYSHANLLMREKPQVCSHSVDATFTQSFLNLKGAMLTMTPLGFRNVSNYLSLFLSSRLKKDFAEFIQY